MKKNQLYSEHYYCIECEEEYKKHDKRSPAEGYCREWHTLQFVRKLPLETMLEAAILSATVGL